MNKIEFAVARIPTPLFNHPHFYQSFGGSTGLEVLLDSQGLLRDVETVAFPGTKFKILNEFGEGIFSASTREYECREIFVDKRFLTMFQKEPLERKKPFLNRSDIIDRMRSLIGTRYIWGGSWPLGIPELLEYYPPKKPLLDPMLQDIWQLKGVDCSGLLYYATQGSTPRNTSELVNFGQAVPIKGKTAQAIASMLLPLDLIVWSGHVIIVCDQGESIESLLGHGVVTSFLYDRIEKIIYHENRIPADQYVAGLGSQFVVRRFEI